MAEQMRGSIMAHYPLPGGGRVALSILSDSMTSDQYAQLTKVIEALVPLAESLGWSREGQPPAKPERRKRVKAEPAPPRLSAVPAGDPVTGIAYDFGGMRADQEERS